MNTLQKTPGTPVEKLQTRTIIAQKGNPDKVLIICETFTYDDGDTWALAYDATNKYHTMVCTTRDLSTLVHPTAEQVAIAIPDTIDIDSRREKVV